MEGCLGIINYTNIENDFGFLCNHRSSYMLPFGGRYRIIDFALSNMVNHGAKTVAVYTGEKVRSTMDHIGNGKPWELNRRINGLYIFPPQRDGQKKRKGDIYQYHLTEDFFHYAKEEYIYIVNPNIIDKVDLTEAFKFFKDSNADITLIYNKKQDGDHDNYINTDKLIIDENGKVINIGLNLGTEKEFNMHLSMGFMKKEVFLNIVREAMESGEDLTFRRAMLRYRKKYNINSYEYKGHTEVIRNIQSYYNANINLLNNTIFKELFFQGGPIYTKSKDEPSTMYTDTSQVNNSIIANGCIIEGKVENSIIFRGVKIEKNAVVKNSIIMQKGVIKENSLLVNAILDKYVTIGKHISLAGSKSNPYLVSKNTVIDKE